MYSQDNGFFITYYYSKGFWHESVVDDYIPVIQVENKELDFEPIFMKPFNLGIGPLILEKAYSKRNECYILNKK